MLKWGPIKNTNAHCVATKKNENNTSKDDSQSANFYTTLTLFSFPFFLLEREKEREKERGFIKILLLVKISCIIKHRRLEFLFGEGGFLNFDILLKTKAIPKLTHEIYFVLQQSLKSILKPVFQ